MTRKISCCVLHVLKRNNVHPDFPDVIQTSYEKTALEGHIFTHAEDTFGSGVFVAERPRE